MKSCQPRANIVVPQGFATGAYATSVPRKRLSLVHQRQPDTGAAKTTSAPMARTAGTPASTVTAAIRTAPAAIGSRLNDARRGPPHRCQHRQAAGSARTKELAMTCDLTDRIFTDETAA